jgi:hypothetical protein
MQSQQLLFWRASATVKLSPAEIARELLWGEEVQGLIDLPVREIIDRLKAEFPKHEEKPGLLIVHAATGSFEATWSWQHYCIDYHDLPPADRDRLIDAIESFDCMAYSP